MSQKIYIQFQLTNQKIYFQPCALNSICILPIMYSIVVMCNMQIFCNTFLCRIFLLAQELKRHTRMTWGALAPLGVLAALDN